MNKTAGAVIGAILGFVVLGAAGFGLGFVYLFWFGPAICCGLEGMYPLLVGTLTGALLGTLSGALAGVVVVRHHPLKLLRLVLLLAAGVTAAWALSLVIGEWSVEQLPGILFFLALTMYIPVIAWIADAWEKPDTSI